MWDVKSEYRLHDNTEDDQKGYAKIIFQNGEATLEVNEKPWDPKNTPQKIYFDARDFKHFAEAIVNCEFL